MTLRRKTIISTKVIAILQNASAPLSISQILNALASMNLNPNKTTIYRLIDKLVEDNVLTSITLSNSTTYYELANKGHHHHFFCEMCQQIFCLNSCHLDTYNINLDGLLPSNNFKIYRHDFNLYGVCENCIHSLG